MGRNASEEGFRLVLIDERRLTAPYFAGFAVMWEGKRNDDMVNSDVGSSLSHDLISE